MEVSLKSPCNLKDKETKIANANQLPKTTIITAGESGSKKKKNSRRTTNQVYRYNAKTQNKSLF